MRTRKYLRVIAFLIGILLCLVDFLIIWVLRTWKNGTMEQLMYHLNANIEGTSSEIVQSGVLHTFIPTIIVGIIFLWSLRYKPKWINKIILCILLWTSLVWTILFCKLNVFKYIQLQLTDSDFIEREYVDPANVKVEFPEKKRNLIFIYLESMETTYSSKQSGGGFERDIIPELTQLAIDNECFSDGKSINGCSSVGGTQWTAGALWASMSGLPLKIDIQGNAMDTQNTFFSGIVTMGDLLEQEGYKNELIIGSDATFGGRGLMFSQHGDYIIHDYQYAIDSGLIPRGYKVSWGYEDKKLFEIAKSELVELSCEDVPFNLTLLTVDTHAEDGFVCDLCENDYENNQYANVIGCSSRQVYDFIKWLEQQDFYDNTSVVICGDHLTMDSDFCDSVSSEYVRKGYLSYINSASKREDYQKREYSIFDVFPTTLAALGCNIDGNRLGLGVNLFSEEKSIIEKYDISRVNEELGKKSEFMSRKAAIDYESALSDDLLNIDCVPIDANSSNAKVCISLDNLVEVDGLQLGLYEKMNGSCIDVLNCTRKEGNEYEAQIDTSKCNYISIIATINNNDTFVECKLSDKLFSVSQLLLHDDFEAYLTALKEQINKGDMIMFMVISDEGTSSLDEGYCNLLDEIGIQTALSSNHYRDSYVVVVENGKAIVEEVSEGYIKREGETSDGSVYNVASGGYNSNKKAEIKINGRTQIIPKRGMNFVIYSTTIHKVVDIANFDTYSGDGL